MRSFLKLTDRNKNIALCFYLGNKKWDVRVMVADKTEIHMHDWRHNKLKMVANRVDKVERITGDFRA